MIREINEEALKSINQTSNKLIQTEINQLKIPTNQIKPIPLYHPSFQNASNILTQLCKFRDENYSTYLKYTILCGIGVPISLPMAIIPVIPNVPGFYLAYRFYCNLKALMGLKHLDYLLERDSDASTATDTKHLTFIPQTIIDDIYKQDNSQTELIIDSVQEEERLIITPEIIEQVIEKLQLPQLKEDLSKALRQETKRLGKNIKVDDAIQ